VTDHARSSAVSQCDPLHFEHINHSVEHTSCISLSGIFERVSGHPNHVRSCTTHPPLLRTFTAAVTVSRSLPYLIITLP